jgi:hypothetical protein
MPSITVAAMVCSRGDGLRQLQNGYQYIERIKARQIGSSNLSSD